MDICICITESLFCTAETNSSVNTLSSNKKILIKKRKGVARKGSLQGRLQERNVKENPRQKVPALNHKNFDLKKKITVQPRSHCSRPTQPARGPGTSHFPSLNLNFSYKGGHLHPTVFKVPVRLIFNFSPSYGKRVAFT